MDIFWCLILFISICELCLLYKAETVNIRRLKCLIYGTAVALVLALRSPQNGVDLISYCPSFLKISHFSLAEAFTHKFANFEQGFIVYNRLVAYIFDDIHSFIALTAFITISLISWVIYKFSKNIYLSFIIFICFGLYTMCFSGLRQALAFSITFVSFFYLLNGKPLKFLVLVLLAATFHRTAIIFGGAWFIRNLKLPASRGIGFLALYAILILPVLRIVTPFLTALLFGDKYAHYYNEGGAYTMAIVYALVFCTSYLVKAKETPLLQLLRWMILIATMLQCLGMISSSSITRIAYYFSIFFCLFIPEILSNIDEKKRYILNPFIAVLFVIFFGLTMSSGYLNVVPYHFFWENGYTDPLPFPDF